MAKKLSELEKTKLPFGKHQGKTFDDTPLDYLDWLMGEGWFTEQRFPDLYPALRDYLNHDTIKRELEKLED